MFETFNVPGLYISVQSVLSLSAGYAYLKSLSDDDSDTGVGYENTSYCALPSICYCIIRTFLIDIHCFYCFF
jgi:actin-related protein